MAVLCFFSGTKIEEMIHPEVKVYPSFVTKAPVSDDDKCLSGVGSCCIFVKDDDISSIISKTILQKQANDNDNSTNHNKDDDNKQQKLAKKYMKQSVAEAQEYLMETLGIDVSIVNVHLCLESCRSVIESDGCLVSCWLDAGCDKVLLPSSPSKLFDDDDVLQEALKVARVPKDRLMVHMSSSSYDNHTNSNVSTTTSTSSPSSMETLSTYVCGVNVTLSLSQNNNNNNNNNNDTNNSMDTNEETTADKKQIFVKSFHPIPVTLQIKDLSQEEDDNMQEESSSVLLRAVKEWASIDGIVALSLTDPTSQQLGLAYIAVRVRTDRPDGLYTTVVCTRNNEALGLVYSSKESIVAALTCGRGVYYSRSRNGLWRKGDTSGHYQTLHRIDVDCDGDAVRFMVTQQTSTPKEQPAFCHLHTLTCWGEPPGLKNLELTLQRRIHEAPKGSYTKRLFDDAELLKNKLVEEAQELAEADTKQHVAEELADVLYFAMVRAAALGVSLDDAAAELDKRAHKVTRRKGDAKTERIAAADKILNTTKNTTS